MKTFATQFGDSQVSTLRIQNRIKAQRCSVENGDELKRPNERKVIFFSSILLLSSFKVNSYSNNSRLIVSLVLSLV